MKSQLASILFAFVLGCGGRAEPPTPVEKAPVAKTDDVVISEPTDVPKVDVVKAEPIAEVALPDNFKDALALGKSLVDKGEHPRAREILELAAKLDKKSAEPHIELARSYIAKGERALAIKSANKAIKLAPESSQAYNTLGRAELLRHSYENAIVAFRQATELNADNVWAWNNLGFTYLTLEQYDEAVTALVEATSRKTATGYMWNNLGTAYEHLDQLDDAREAFESGGKLGSVAAASSRKRLEGVDTIVIVKADVPKDSDSKEPVVQEFEHSEPMPPMPDMPDVVEPAVDDDDEIEEPKVEESGVDAKVETKTEEVDDEIKGDEPVASPAPAIL